MPFTIDKIMQLQVFESGEEPLVAASGMELFLFLPGASQYVEDLVRVTLQLESVMYKYNPESSSSPFRKPLATFLNKHYSSKCNCISHDIVVLGVYFFC